MLMKLMKHEFRATGRIMLPLYLVLLVTAVGANFTTRGLLSTQYRLLDVLGVLLVTAFGVAIVGVCAMSLVVMVQRFYKNLLQDEGYVMMTLPVSVHQQVWSKLLVSTVWFAATVVMVFLACCVMAFDLRFVGDFFRAVGQGRTPICWQTARLCSWSLWCCASWAALRCVCSSTPLWRWATAGPITKWCGPWPAFSCSSSSCRCWAPS